MKNRLIHYNKFPALFEGLGNLGEPFDIRLQPGARPYALFTPRNIPIPLRQRVRQELDRMLLLGVISKVDIPSPWCAGMVVVPKKEWGYSDMCGFQAS